MTLFSPFITAYAQSDLFGRLIILGLIFLSIVCWVLLIYKIWLTRHVQRISNAFDLACRKNKERLLHIALQELPHPPSVQIPHPFKEVFQTLQNKTLEVLNKNLYFSQKEQGKVHLSLADLDVIESTALITVSSQIKKLEKNLFVLAT